MTDSHLKILIIDDDKNFRKILSMRLKSRYKNCSIQEAGTLDSARKILTEILNEKTFDLIILDQHLPDGTGSDFLSEEATSTTPVLSMSSDEAPEIPATTLVKGARFFLSKKNVSEPFFLPLTESLIERSQVEKKMRETARSAEILESVKTLLRTLRHEINNPLGAVFGAMYVLRSDSTLSEDNSRALHLIHESTQRIKKVLDALSETTELEIVDKATEKLFQIPGDPEWNKK